METSWASLASILADLVLVGARAGEFFSASAAVADWANLRHTVDAVPWSWGRLTDAASDLTVPTFVAHCVGRGAVAFTVVASRARETISRGSGTSGASVGSRWAGNRNRSFEGAVVTSEADTTTLTTRRGVSLNSIKDAVVTSLATVGSAASDFGISHTSIRAGLARWALILETSALGTVVTLLASATTLRG